MSQNFGAFSVSAPTALPNLSIAAERRPEQSTITLDWAAAGAPDGLSWLHHWTDGDEVLLSMAQQNEGYWLRVPGYADFFVRLRPCTVLVFPTHGSLDGLTLEHLLVDQILPRVAAQLGGTLIHASTIRIGERQVLFIGPSGWGKSTLAGLLYSAGHRILSDDCAQLIVAQPGHVRAVPTYPSLRLCVDSLAAIFPSQVGTVPVASYSNKRRIPIPAVEATDVTPQVDALYLLGDPAQNTRRIQITPVTPALSCLTLIRHSFRLDLFDREASALHLQQCGEIADAIPAFQLDYPRDYARQDELVDAVLGHIATLPHLSPSPGRL